MAANDRDGRRARRILFLLWIRNRVALLLMMAGGLLLLVSPAALVGEGPGFFGLVFDTLATLFVLALLITHPMLKHFVATILTREVGAREKLDRIQVCSL